MLLLKNLFQSKFNALLLAAVVLSFSFYTNKASAQAPGAFCTTAVAIGGTGNVPGCTGAQTMTDFTQEVTTPAMTCIGGGIFRREGWYTFNAPGGQPITVTGTATSGTSNLLIQVISGTCGAGTEVQIGCANNINSNTSQTEAVSLGILAAGTYFIRVVNVGAVGNMAVSNICVNITPSNDDCANATSLTPLVPSASCGGTAGFTSGATQQAAIPAVCGAANTTNDDVWYTFTTTASSHVITVAPTATMDVVFQVYSTNPCGGAGTSVNCVNVNGASGTETLTMTGLGIGVQYWIRVYDAGTGIPASSTFTICIQTPPVNDNCATATVLTPSGSCVPVTGDVNVATPSGVPTSAGCAGSNPDDDVWYSFVASGTSHTVTVTGLGSFDTGFEVFLGPCGSLTSMVCVAPGSAPGSTQTIVIATTPGSTYYVRVYDYNVGAPGTTTFTICILNPPPPNDDCAGAIALTSLTSTCVAGSNEQTGDVSGATQSAVATCGGIANDDVWYSFTTTATNLQNYVVTSTGVGVFDPVLQVYSGTCAALVSIACVNATGGGGTETTTLTTGVQLTANTTYWIRVYDAGAGYPVNTTFTVCVTIPPINDNCSGAIALTPLTTNCINNSNQQTGTDLGATQTLAGCSGNANDDVWYTFTTTATANQAYVITGVGNGTFDPVVQVFSTSCGGTSLSCLNATGAGGTETVTLTAGVQLTINTQYWIRVYDAGAGYPGNTTFTICVTIPTPPPANDPCSNATPLNASYTCTPTAGTVGGATPDGYANTCGGTPSDDVWYSFWPNSTTATVTITGSAGFNPVIEVFQGSCAGSNFSCTNVNGIGGGEIANLSALQPFTQYFIRVYDFSGSPTTYNFTICITEPAVVAADCFSAYSICSNFTFHIQPNSIGTIQDLPAYGSFGNPGGCMAQLEQSPTWWLINISGTGTLEFTLGLGTQASFYDWIMYPYTGNCAAIPGNTVAPVRCNYNATTVGGTGIVSSVPAGGSAGNYSMPALPVTAGQQYVVMFNNWSHVTTNVPLVFGGTASISCVAPLPIELLWFNGQRQNDGTNIIKWASATETNNDYFMVKRSSDAANWETIGIIDGAGNSDSEKDYQVIDRNPPPGLNYYRLTQVDFNGMAFQFNIISIDNTNGPSGKIIRTTNMLGQDVPLDYEGFRMVYYSNGVVIKKYGKEINIR